MLPAWWVTGVPSEKAVLWNLCSLKLIISHSVIQNSQPYFWDSWSVILATSKASCIFVWEVGWGVTPPPLFFIYLFFIYVDKGAGEFNVPNTHIGPHLSSWIWTDLFLNHWYEHLPKQCGIHGSHIISEKRSCSWGYANLCIRTLMWNLIDWLH